MSLRSHPKVVIHLLLNVCPDKIINQLKICDYGFCIILLLFSIVGGLHHIGAAFAELLMRFSERLAELVGAFHDFMLQVILQAAVPDILFKFLHEVIILGGAVVNSQSLTLFDLFAL